MWQNNLARFVNLTDLKVSTFQLRIFLYRILCNTCSYSLCSYCRKSFSFTGAKKVLQKESLRQRLCTGLKEDEEVVPCKMKVEIGFFHDILNSIAGLVHESDGLSSQSLDNNLHTSSTR